MIDFRKFPREKNITYTVIPRRYSIELRKALQLANETNWEIRKCHVKDKSAFESIKHHIPKNIDATHTILISYFKPEDIQFIINLLKDDPDIKASLEKDRKNAYDEYMHSSEYKPL